MAADPAAHAGRSFVCLDATPLLHFNNHGLLPQLGALTGDPSFVAEYILEEEIKAPMRGGPRYRKNHAILKAPWISSVALADPGDIQRVADLKRRLGGKRLSENLGEAHAIALAERYGWTLVMDDEGGRLAANDPDDGPIVPTVYMVTLLAAAAGFGEISVDAAWTIHKTIEDVRRRSIILPTQREAFRAAARAFSTIRGKAESWPEILGRGKVLDDLVISERRRIG